MFQAGSCLTLGSLYSAKVIDTKDTGLVLDKDEGRGTQSFVPRNLGQIT